ncbi:MAG: PilZ domain-containing protein [Pseudomonadota bacterium]
MGEESRQYKRADINIKALSPDISEEIKIVNLSTHGAFLVSKLILDIGEEFSLSFTLPDDQDEIRVGGQVVWNRDKGDNPGMGIQFMGLSEVNFDKLLHYIEELYK